MSKSWVVKFLPKDLSQVIGQETVIKEIQKFIETFKGQKKKACLLYGPPGCGKTTVAQLIAKKYNYELVEMNASDFRNKKSIEEFIGPALKQQSLFYRGKLILIDEVDGLSGRKDRGGLTTVLNFAKTTPFPILMTCENAYSDKMSKIRSKVNLMKFALPSHTDIFELLQSICQSEKIEFEEKALKTIARRAGGDVRSALNDAQTLAQVGKKITSEEINDLQERWRAESITTALIKVFKNSDPAIALSAFDNVHEDLDKCLLWVDENLPKEYKDPHDLAEAYDKLSLAAVFRGRIIRRQYWRFLVYVNVFMTAGVATAKKTKPSGFVTYAPAQRLLKIWRANMKYMKRKAIAQKIAEACHTSSKRALHDIFPYVQHMIGSNPALAESFAVQFDLNQEEVAWIKKT